MFYLPRLAKRLKQSILALRFRFQVMQFYVKGIIKLKCTTYHGVLFQCTAFTVNYIKCLHVAQLRLGKSKDHGTAPFVYRGFY